MYVKPYFCKDETNQYFLIEANFLHQLEKNEVWMNYVSFQTFKTAEIIKFSLKLVLANT
jgi:hypothetical protein